MISTVVRNFTVYDWYQLVRPRLSLMVALSALSGYMAAPAQHTIAPAVSLFVGVFLLTATASILNQVQERERDRLLPRTRLRPLATGRMEPHLALLLAGIHLLISLQLIASVSATSAGIGMLALLWYNLVYTPLKTRTSLVLLLGALGGAMPPLLGWTASGASPYEPRAVHLYMVLVLWQVPHFWCLAMKDGLFDRALDLKIIPAGWRVDQLKRLIRLWCLALGALLLVALPLGLITSYVTISCIAGLAALCSFFVAGRHPHLNIENWSAKTGLRLHIVLSATLLLITLDTYLPF